MVVVAAIALLIRTLFFIAYTPVLDNDSFDYLDLAHRFGATNLTGYDGLRTPGYPLLLLVVHYSARWMWVVQSLLGVAITVLIYRLVRRLSGGPVAALLAALWFATSLVAVSTERELMTETAATFLMVVSATLALKIVGSSDRTAAGRLLLGLVLAAFCLTRPDALGVSIYMAIALALIMRVSRRQSVRAAVTILVPAIIVLVGWAGVNKTTTGLFTVSTVLGHNMIDHVAPQVTVQPGRNHAITAAYVAWRARANTKNNISFFAWNDMERASHLSYAHLSSRLLGIGLSVIAHHPLSYVSSSAKQWPQFWLPPRYVKAFPGTDRSSVLGAVASVQRGLQALFGLVFLGLCVVDVALRLRGRRGILGAGAAMLAGAVLIASLQAVFLAYGETGRYGLPYAPLVLAVTFGTLGSGRSLEYLRSRLAARRAV